jgi:hypothetical protein
VVESSETRESKAEAIKITLKAVAENDIRKLEIT